MTDVSPRPTTVPCDICVVGASAGGVETLTKVLGRLPDDHPGTVLVVLHLSATGPSVLPHILDRACALPCRAAADGEPLLPGTVLVAPPNLHLAIADDQVRLVGGPRENGLRPSVDVLFRSAAVALGPRVLGVVLSGTGSDGTVGLAEVKVHGGVAAVQDPADAQHQGMPRNALDRVAVDVVADAPALGRLIGEAARARPPAAVLGGGAPLRGPEADSPRLDVVCPECGGTLGERDVGGVPIFACHVGHRYSADGLVDEQREAVERALWTAARTLEERCLLLSDMAHRADREGRPRTAAAWRRRAEEAQADVRLLRDAINRQAVAESGLPGVEGEVA
jgi:two-component system chemotaxis response regulator CheB